MNEWAPKSPILVSAKCYAVGIQLLMVVFAKQMLWSVIFLLSFDSKLSNVTEHI